MAVSSIIRSVVRSPVRGAVAGDGDGGALLDAATAYLGGIEPYHWMDFTTNRSLFAGINRGNIANTPGFSITRASVGTAETVSGSIIQFASGELRRTDRGVLIEGARTNLFLNSETGATQGLSVTAVVHTLSFRGTGTITLSGASTAGPLIGAGANDWVTLTFTPSAATLTLTVSGSCTNVQLEVGSFRTSWIPTAGASVARAADIITISSPGLTYPTTLWAEFERLGDSGAAETVTQLDDGTNNERAALRISATDLLNAFMVDGAVTQGDVTVAGAVALATTYKAAAAFDTNRVQACRSATLGTADTTATLPAPPTVWRIGSNAAGGQIMFGYTKRLAAIASALSDANLQTAAP